MKKSKKSKSALPMAIFAVNVIRLTVAIYVAIIHPFGPFDDPS